MTKAGPNAATKPFWRRRSLQLAAVAALVFLSLLYNYLEAMPVARGVRADDAKSFLVTADRPIRLGGIAGGDVVAFQLQSAKRLVLTLPGDAELISPARDAFLDKARREAATITGYGGNQIIMVAETAAHERVSVALQFSGTEAANRTDNALLLQRAAPEHFTNGLSLTTQGAPVRLTVDLSRNLQSPAVGRMMLSDKGTAATLGHAEFLLKPGATLTGEFLEGAPGPGASSRPVTFDLVQGEAPLRVRSIAAGSIAAGGVFAADHIACATGRHLLWWKVLPKLGLSDCGPEALAVTGFDFSDGRLTFAGDAFFKGVGDADTARYVTWLRSNLIVQLLIGALLSSLLIPWAIKQFKGEKREEPAPAKGTRGRRGKPS